jgi:hypothetical protein
LGSLRVTAIRGAKNIKVLKEFAIGSGCLISRCGMKKKALVIGGGIQGCCVALALLGRDYHVTVIDQASALIRRASFNSEGKIHLGFVYAMDHTLETGQRMVRDGLAFGPAMETLLSRKLPWDTLITRPFEYWTAHDSLLSNSETAAYFQALATYSTECLAADPGLHYLGDRDAEFFHSIKVPQEVNPQRISAAFSSMERGVDQTLVRTLITEALLNHPDFVHAPNEKVTAVEVSPHESRLVSQLPAGEIRTRTGDLTINCSWESLDALDISAGLRSAEAELPNLRLKVGVITDANPSLDRINPFTIVHGAYGDFVTNQDGSHYFCWYPVSLKGMVRALHVPTSWEPWLRGEFTPEFREELGAANERAFRELLPDLKDWRVREMRAGVIVARGVEDIYQRHTRLHFRKDYPIRHHESYWSISTGKFTSGPANALEFGRVLDATQRS